MSSKFQYYLIEEVESFGEISLQDLIPKFLEKNYNKFLRFPLSEYPENYIIDDKLFSILLRELKEVIGKEKLRLYRYNNKNGKNWEDTFDLLPENQTSNVLTNVQYYIYKEGNPIFYLSPTHDSL